MYKCNAKDAHIFPTKNNSVFVIDILNFNETLISDVVLNNWPLILNGLWQE